jgi:hypothetical protein
VKQFATELLIAALAALCGALVVILAGEQHQPKSNISEFRPIIHPLDGA